MQLEYTCHICTKLTVNTLITTELRIEKLVSSCKDCFNSASNRTFLKPLDCYQQVCNTCFGLFQCSATIQCFLCELTSFIKQQDEFTLREHFDYDVSFTLHNDIKSNLIQHNSCALSVVQVFSRNLAFFLIDQYLKYKPNDYNYNLSAIQNRMYCINTLDVDKLTILSQKYIYDLPKDVRYNFIMNTILDKVKPRSTLRPLRYKIKLQKAPLIFSGFYSKFSRNIAQTKWFKSQGIYSIEQIFSEQLDPLFKGDVILIGAGREDYNVCTWNKGRPFLIVIKHPTYYPTIHKDFSSQIELNINHKYKNIVRISDFKYITEGAIEVGKLTKKFNDTISQHSKVYSAVVLSQNFMDQSKLDSLNEQFSIDIFRHCFATLDTQLCKNTNNVIDQCEFNASSKKATVDNISNEHIMCTLAELNSSKQDSIPSVQPVLHVNQRTPVRVLHSRTDKNRVKSLFALHIVRMYNCTYQVLLWVSSGFYIKEFINSDFSRTNPSLSSLLDSKVDIVQLDLVCII